MYRNDMRRALSFIPFPHVFLFLLVKTTEAFFYFFDLDIIKMVAHGLGGDPISPLLIVSISAMSMRRPSFPRYRGENRGQSADVAGNPFSNPNRG